MSTGLNISVQLKPFKDLEVSKIMCETVDLPLKTVNGDWLNIGKIIFFFFLNLFSGRILNYSFKFLKMLLQQTAVCSSSVGLTNAIS